MTEERRKGIAAEAEQHAMRGGVLYHKWESGEEGVVWQLVVPEVDGLREELLEKAHKGNEGPHESGKKMYERLRRDRMWRGMLAACEEFRKRCATCKEREVINNGLGLLVPTTSEELRGRKRVALDLAGPFPPSRKGNTMALVTIDYDTGWPAVSALPDATSKAVADGFFEAWVQHRGVPDQLLTDLGKNINSELAQAIYADLGLDKLTTAAGNPQADGAAEALVKRSMNLLAKLVAERPGDWDEHVADVNLELRSQWKMPQRMSPFKAETGGEMKLPSAWDVPKEEVESVWMADKLKVRELVARRRDEAAEEMKERHDAGREPASFKEGDLVWWRKHEPEGKLDVKRTGPYVVKKVHGPLDVVLDELPQGPKIGQRHRVVNVKHVEKYEQEVPRTVEEAVESIVKHKRRGKKVTYLVRWEDGSETWEPLRNLIDKEGEETIVNEALLEYWREHPEVKQEAGQGVL